MKLARPIALALFIALAAAAAEWAMGRHAICTCGAVGLWVGARDSAETSQMLLDWYSLSHLVHGLLFYALLWFPARRLDVRWRFVIAMFVEAAWEVIENTPMIIDRYRATTAALGFSGDSIVNSLSDMLMMAIGFIIARRFPLWVSVAVVLLLELIPLLVIRDNLALNIWNLLAPNDAVAAWQSSG